MWRLKRITAENLCAFRELDYCLNQGITTLVFGDNKDNESQRSNGSGKSALLEAIAIGITGSPMRKVKNEEIIRDNTDECRVKLTFDNDASDEVFSVERQLSRKGSSVVVCHIERNGQATETDETVQPSVDAYNRYILKKLGITREELYNHFLLSKYKYSDFLSSSDREKKEIINRFSHANLVDQAIEKLIADYTPISQDIRNTELEIAGIEGRINMLQEQIKAEEENRTESSQRKEKQIHELKGRITEKQNIIYKCQEGLAAGKLIYEKLATADSAMQQLENSESELEECLTFICRETVPLLHGKLTDWEKVLKEKKAQLHETGKVLQACEDELSKARETVCIEEEKYDQLNTEYKDFEIRFNEQQTGYDCRLKELAEESAQTRIRLVELKIQKFHLGASIENLKNKLAGGVSCPSCGHEFLIAEKDFDLTGGRKLLAYSEQELEALSKEIEQHECSVEESGEAEESIHRDKWKLDKEWREWSQRLSLIKRDLESVRHEQEDVFQKRERIIRRLALLEEETNGLRRRLFDEVFGLLDEAYQHQERRSASLEEEIRATEQGIRTLEDTIRELQHVSTEEVIAGLQVSLQAYRKKSMDMLKEKTEAEKRLRTYQEQEERFMQFKTYLANSKIEALSHVTNEFLENIGSDIRIRFSGYTVLKTGKVREKISVSLLREGVDCGSFGKFSAGEAARVNLATILAMQKLVNGNCEGDKGLDLLVLDEILEAVDEEGLSSMFAAINKLGITTLIVSHGNVAEGYPNKLVIKKENGESKIA